MFNDLSKLRYTDRSENKNIMTDAKAYWEGRLANNYNLAGVGYLNLGINYNKWLYRVRKKVFCRVIRILDVDPAASKVLDIGSGTGFYVERWKDLGVSNLTGIDLTSVAVERLKKEYPEYSFYELDISSEFPAGTPSTFDLVSALDVLFHIVNDDLFERAIANIYNLCKRGGYFLLSDNFLHSNSIVGTYQTNRTLIEIRDLLEGNGFKIISRVPMFVLMNTPIDSTNRLHHLLWGKFTNLIAKNDKFGYFFGLGMYPIELFCTKLMKESPSTEIMLCKKE